MVDDVTPASVRRQAEHLEAELSALNCQHKGFTVQWCPQCAATQIEQALAQGRAEALREAADRIAVQVVADRGSEADQCYAHAVSLVAALRAAGQE